MDTECAMHCCVVCSRNCIIATHQMQENFPTLLAYSMHYCAIYSTQAKEIKCLTVPVYSLPVGIAWPCSSYDRSTAVRKLSLQPRPRTMPRLGGLLKWLPSSSMLASWTAVCRLSKELDFFRPRDGPYWELRVFPVVEMNKSERWFASFLFLYLC